MVKWKQTHKGDFFENKLLLQLDVVFDSESMGRNFSSLAPPGGEKKKLFSTFFFKMTSRVGVGVFIRYFWLNWKLKKSTTILFFGLRSYDLSVF